MDDPFPVPLGTPEELRAAARAFRLVAEQHDSVRSSVLRILGDAADGWSGSFGDRFRTCLAEVEARFRPVCEAAMEASLALASYASALQDAQESIAGLNDTHHDPVVRAHALRRAGDIADDLDAAAAACIRRTGWISQALRGSLPDVSSAAELLADIQRATPESA